MKFKPITREEFLSVPLQLPEDRFAKTFVAKADAMQLWQFAVGAFIGQQLYGAVVFRLSQRLPCVANLQLLHTFAGYRRQGVAKALTLLGYKTARLAGAQYFRVSAEEEAVPFYQALGLRFWGKQKSGSWLCVHRMRSIDLAFGEYLAKDPVIIAAIHSQRRGGIVALFEKPV